MVKLTCNEGCKQEFVLIAPGTSLVRDDILRVWFGCPHCGHEYISHYTNSGIRALQEKQKALLSGPNRNKRKAKRMVKDLQARIKVGMDRLKEEIENEKNQMS